MRHRGNFGGWLLNLKGTSPEDMPVTPKLLPLLFPLAVIAAKADDLQPLGDEFNDATSLSQWQDLGVVEGWNTPSVEAADINTTTPGHFRITPGALTWFNNLRGALFFKEVSGDFIATLRLRILSRHNAMDPLEPPNQPFSLSGVFVHAPRATVQAAPNPYTTNAVWPPAAHGSDWVPNTENYIFLSYGSAGNPGTRQFEIKATRNSDSLLYFDSNGIDQNVNEAWLQMVRVGDTVVCLRKHSAAGAWLVENRYPNADHPFPEFGDTLQLGITAYTDWNTAQNAYTSGDAAMFHFNYAPPNNGNPDLISEVDYYRFQRPDPALTELVLQGMNVNYNPATNQSANPPVTLAASPLAAPYLGDQANIPVGRLLVNDVVFAESSQTVMIPVSRTNHSQGAVSCDYEFQPGTALPDDYISANGTLNWADGDAADKMIELTLPHDRLAEGEESFSVRLTSLNGPANFAGGALERTITATIEDHPLDQWRLDQFGGQANAPEGQLTADFDEDDFANLLERLLSTDPTASNPDPLQSNQVGDRMTLSFTPDSEALEAELVVEACDDLAAESWMPLATREAGQSNWTLNDPEAGVEVDGATGQVTVTDAVSLTVAERRFMRLAAGVGG